LHWKRMIQLAGKEFRLRERREKRFRGGGGGALAIRCIEAFIRRTITCDV
jgi:hypothetical protein